MFTGIVEERGIVRRTGERLVVEAGKVSDDSGPGASVAVNGVCLTVVERSEDHALSFDLSPETLARTSLGRLRPGDPVNLERAVTLLTRLGGHMVQGHVDGVGQVATVESAETGAVVWFTLPSDLARYVVEKGSIAVEGVSLTVTGVRDGRFGVALVPYTLDATTLGTSRPGEPVNLEVDVVAKYVEGFLRASEG
jgi:riboflavin synthase